MRPLRFWSRRRFRRSGWRRESSVGRIGGFAFFLRVRRLVVDSGALIPTMTSQLPLKRLVIGVFLVTCASLLIELTLTRLFSVLLWYHFAFLAISLGLVGISAGAATASLLPSFSRGEGLAARIARFSMLACISAAVALLVLLRTRTSDQVSAAMMLRVAGVCVVGAIPFFFAGLV